MGKLQVPAVAFQEFAEGEKLITPGWHTFEAVKTEGPVSSTKGDSMNYWLYVKCLTPEFVKRNIPRICFNEKSFSTANAKYQVVPFILALDPSLTAKDLAVSGISIDFDAIIGKKFDAKVSHKEYNGRFSEELKDYAPAGTRVSGESN